MPKITLYPSLGAAEFTYVSSQFWNKTSARFERILRIRIASLTPNNSSVVLVVHAGHRGNKCQLYTEAVAC